jgi:membrane associated rhomboid family serine protease
VQIGTRGGTQLDLPSRVNSIILLAVLGAVAYRVASPAERDRALRYVRHLVAAFKAVMLERREGLHAFRLVVRARTSRPVVTPALVAIWVIVAGGLLFGAAPMSDSDALLGWGASIGTRTTHGEWWRLATAMLVHTGVLQLAINLVVLVQIGLLLERLAGRSVIAAVYLSGGVMAGIASLSSHPVAVTASASGPIAALYGLTAALLLTQYGPDLVTLKRRGAVRFGQSAVAEPDPELEAEAGFRIPLLEVKAIAISGAVFLLYTAVASPSALWGFAVGLGYGAMLAPLGGDRPPTPRRVATSAAIMTAIAAMFALPLRNIADVKPEIARVFAAEEHTTKAYQVALDGFKKGRATVEALAHVAGGANVAELQEVDARLAALEHVPPEYDRLVHDARDYLRMRSEAWRLRADAVRRMNVSSSRAADEQPSGPRRIQAEARYRSNMVAMGRAETAERASMMVFERLRAPAVESQP